MFNMQADDLVLIAIIKRPRDLEIARVLGWYRIPLTTAPKTVRVDWLAFYQTAAFGEERWSIRYIASMRGYELVTRAELLQNEADHPRAREPYLKIQLGPLETLPKPIPSQRWRRITFLYTIGDRLMNAQDLSELTMPHAQDRELIWKLVRERGMDQL